MGLYQSELTKQIHLRKLQKKEWERMKKKRFLDNQQQQTDLSNKQTAQVESEERAETLRELEETEASKRLASAMVKSSLEMCPNTLKKAVDVIQNQNGNYQTLVFNVSSGYLSHFK